MKYAGTPRRPKVFFTERIDSILWPSAERLHALHAVFSAIDQGCQVRGEAPSQYQNFKVSQTVSSI